MNRTKEKIRSEKISEKRTQQVFNQIKLNVLPECIKVRCYTDKELGKWKVWVNENASTSLSEQKYTNFELADDSDDGNVVSIPLKNNPYNARSYYLHTICSYFERLKVVQEVNFILQPQYWVLAGRNQSRKRAEYWVFTIDVDCSDTSFPLLQINYNGTRQLSMESLAQKSYPDGVIRKVIYNWRVTHVDAISSQTDIPLSKIFPVLNASVPGERPTDWIKKNTDKYDDSYAKIKLFIEKYLDQPDFRALTGLPARKISLVKADKILINKVDEKQRTVLFGERKPHVNYDLLHIPLYAEGPYRRPAVTSMKLMCIGEAGGVDAERDQIVSGLLAEFKKVTSIHTEMVEQCIAFRQEPNLEQDVRNQLMELAKKDKLPTMMVYISPYNKWETNREKWQLYFNIQKVIREFKIPVITIYRNNVFSKSFNFFSKNLIIKMIFRLNGLPWIAHYLKNDSLVIGIGAYRVKHSKQTYVAASCFYNEADARHDDDVFQARSIEHIADFLKTVIQKYCSENKAYKRIVIHYHKQLNKKEDEALRKVLKETNNTLELYVLHISNPGRSGLLLYESGKDKSMLPEHGTYVRVKPNQYYVYLNRNRKGVRKTGITGQAWPLKVYIQAVKTEHPENVYSKTLIYQLSRYSLMNYDSTQPGVIPATIKRTQRLAKNCAFGAL